MTTGKQQKHHSVLALVAWGLIGLLFLLFAAHVIEVYVLHHDIRWYAIRDGVFYPEGDVRGIDISHYQETIDWDALAESTLHGVPVSFVFIKATEGKTIIDECFTRNFSEARRHGILRGAYHVYSTLSSPQEQARFFCNVVGLKDNDIVPILDVEGLGTDSPEHIQTGILDWMNLVEKHYGVTPILYTSYNFRTTYLTDPQFDRYPYWIAHYYIKNLAYTGRWAFWQHTDVGKVGGVKGYVDVNVFNGGYSDLLRLTVKENRKENKE